MNYEIDIKIDETALDVEWLNQPSLAIKYGKYWADCFKANQRAEENIKLIRAELVAEVTSDPDTCLGKGVKATGPVIEAYYRNHKRHIEAKEEWMEAQHQMNIAEIAKKEISYSRKSALENLVKLHGQNYFAGPNIPRDLSQEAFKKEVQKKSDVGVAGKMIRKPKNN